MTRTCEDCGEETKERRRKCPHCGMLCCAYCFRHYHGAWLAKPQLDETGSCPRSDA